MVMEADSIQFPALRSGSSCLERLSIRCVLGNKRELPSASGNRMVTLASYCELNPACFELHLHAN